MSKIPTPHLEAVLERAGANPDADPEETAGRLDALDAVLETQYSGVLGS